MSDIMNELRNVYLDFFGLDNGKMPDDEKRIMTERYRAGNSTTKEMKEHTIPEEGHLNGTDLISDDAFLKLTPDDRLLYLKRLLEAVLIKSNTPGHD